MKTFLKRFAAVSAVLCVALLCMGIVYIDNTKHYFYQAGGLVQMFVNTNYVFGDVISAMRDRRKMRFTTPESEFFGIINGITLRSRGWPFVWSLTIDGQPQPLTWVESNQPPTVITEA